MESVQVLSLSTQNGTEGSFPEFLSIWNGTVILLTPASEDISMVHYRASWLTSVRMTVEVQVPLLLGSSWGVTDSQKHSRWNKGPRTLSVLLLLWHKLESHGKREPQLKRCLHQTGLWASLWTIFLTDNWYGMAQLTGGGYTPGQVILGALRLSKPWGARQ